MEYGQTYTIPYNNFVSSTIGVMNRKISKIVGDVVGCPVSVTQVDASVLVGGPFAIMVESCLVGTRPS